MPEAGVLPDKGVVSFVPDVRDVDLLAGLLVGATLPFLVAAATRRVEMRSGGSPASTFECVRAMIPAALVALAVPLIVGTLNPMALCGLLVGTIASGVVLPDAVGPQLGVLMKLVGLVAIVAGRR